MSVPQARGMVAVRAAGDKVPDPSGATPPGSEAWTSPDILRCTLGAGPQPRVLVALTNPPLQGRSRKEAPPWRPQCRGPL